MIISLPPTTVLIISVDPKASAKPKAKATAKVAAKGTPKNGGAKGTPEEGAEMEEVSPKADVAGEAAAPREVPAADAAEDGIIPCV